MSMVDKFLDKIGLQRKYAAAKTSHWSGPIGGSATSANAEIGASWSTVTARTQQLVRDYPPFAAAVANIEAFVAGDGMRFQSLVRKPDGTPNQTLAQEIEDKWMAFADSTSSDTSEHLNFVEQTQLAVRSKAEAGEFLFVTAYNPATKNISLRAIDPIRVSDNYVNSRNVWQGVEYDPVTYRRLAYHIQSGTDIDSTTNYLRISSDRVLHGYKSVRPDQLRGITPFAAAIQLAHASKDYIQAELATQVAHSKFTAFVTTPSVGVPGGWDKARWDDTMQRYTERLDYLTMELLSPGQAVTLNSVQRSPNAVAEFTHLTLRLTAASLPLPFELLSQDYRQHNYTTLRAIRNDYKQHLKPQWRHLTDHLCRPLFERWLTLSVLNGSIDIPDYFQNKANYQRGMWIPPGMEPVDPKKEAEADNMRIAAGLDTPQRILAARGLDPETVIKQLAEWRKAVADAGLEYLLAVNGQAPVAPVDEIEDDN